MAPMSSICSPGRTASAALPGSGTRDGYRMIFWKQDDLDLAAVSDVDR